MLHDVVVVIGAAALIHGICLSERNSSHSGAQFAGFASNESYVDGRFCLIIAFIIYIHFSSAVVQIHIDSHPIIIAIIERILCVVDFFLFFFFFFIVSNFFFVSRFVFLIESSVCVRALALIIARIWRDERAKTQDEQRQKLENVFIENDLRFVYDTLYIFHHVKVFPSAYNSAYSICGEGTHNDVYTHKWQRNAPRKLNREKQ